MSNETVYLVLPEVVLGFVATLIYLGGAFLPARRGWSLLAAAGLVVAGVVLFRQGSVEFVQDTLAAGGVSGTLVIDQFALVAEAQETRVELVEKPLPSVQADSDRLAQVLHNFLANGLRHTPAGLITVSGEALPGQVRIRVSDSGEGIAPADLPHIFDRFYRAGDSRPGSNTGLGLAIAKAWVEAMGGTIGVESDAGQGSSFWFTLKAVPAAKTV